MVRATQSWEEGEGEVACFMDFTINEYDEGGVIMVPEDELIYSASDIVRGHVFEDIEEAEFAAFFIDATRRTGMFN